MEKRTTEAEDSGLKKGPWTPEEDEKLVRHVQRHGEGNWKKVRRETGLLRCGKSCRLRWANHLRPNLKRGAMSPDEELLVLRLHALLGNKWARIATHLPGRTDNEIKNYWKTRTKRQERAGRPLYPPEVEREVALIRAGGPDTILDDCDADGHVVEPQELPPFLFDDDATDPLAFVPPPPAPAPDSPSLPYIGDLNIDHSKYLPLAPLLPRMSWQKVSSSSIQPAAAAAGVALDAAAFVCAQEQQAAGAGMVHFETMPGLVSPEDANWVEPPGGGRGWIGDGIVPSLICAQEEALSIGAKCDCVVSGVERPAKRAMASMADDEEMPNLLGVAAGEALGNDGIGDHTVFFPAIGDIVDDEASQQLLMMPSAPLIYGDDKWC